MIGSGGKCVGCRAGTLPEDQDPLWLALLFELAELRSWRKKAANPPSMLWAERSVVIVRGPALVSERQAEWCPGYVPVSRRTRGLLLLSRESNAASVAKSLGLQACYACHAAQQVPISLRIPVRTISPT